jgi:conjugative transfer region protein (TIGR03750 family)
MEEIGMKGREIDFIPDRLIEEPVVFRGLTDTEVVLLITVGAAFWIPTSVLILLPFGFALFGVAAGMGMAIGTLLLVGKYLQNIKRRMPDGLHLVYLKKLLQSKVSFINFGYIETSQSWDIKRSKVVPKIYMESED